MKTIREWFTKGLPLLIGWTVMAVGVVPAQAEGQSLVPLVTASSSVSPASVAGPATFTPTVLSPNASSAGVQSCWRCFCFTGEPPHWSECQGEYGYDCMCEGCNYPWPDDTCRDYGWGGDEACESYIVGGCGGSFSAGGGSDCGCDCDEENNLEPNCEPNFGGSAALLDGTRLYIPSSLLASGPTLSEGQSTTVALKWQGVPGMGDVIRSRCDNTVVARVYTPEGAASVRDALRVLSL